MAKILALYHYFHPDNVAGAMQFTGLCEELAGRSWDIETWPCNRSCHDLKEKYGIKAETYKGVKIGHVWRPAFNQHRFVGRILNSLWVEAVWGWRALFLGKPPHAVILGTDPLFAVLLTPFLKLRWPKARIVHWCFDLYPEYAVAEGIVSENNIVVRLLRKLLRWAYRSCDLVADLGPCMARRLEKYPIRKAATLTPWALEEPDKPLEPDREERKLLFGAASLGLLYSGNLSHPHRYDLILALARKMRERAVFAFSVRGNRVGELRSEVTHEDSNVRFAPFASMDRLAARLSAPDIHLVSLKSSYTGVAVPSKFFGALAAGRPILFEGDEDSSIARWITEYGVGWVLKPDNLDQVAEELVRFSGDQTAKAALFRRCHAVYREHFSKKAVTDRWDKELRGLLEA